MSLSARITVAPSRRLDLAALAIAIGGIAVVAATVAARWPAAAPVVALGALGAAAFVVARAAVRRRLTIAYSLTVSNRAEIDVFPDPRATEGPWRLADTTMAWSGFAVLALRKTDPTIATGIVRMAVLDVDLARDERRALSRFMMWSLRGGDGGASRHSQGPDRS